MECVYANTLDTIEDLLALDAGDLIDYVSDNNETASYMLKIAMDCDVAIYVDDERYGDTDEENEELCAERLVEAPSRAGQAKARHRETAMQE
ncbi:hypothetical protein QO002_004664 [Pararhizobium capsulatum DSM 1112]|uniref:Uncharacterized protein n=1 Tax=Pararhizobium capsulatum DSM 1112 TaxID=1121113 RepID=A0ABU0BW21_9HYPH|nr:hypothetical protein [Pararhizobium capsulatum]MDQ0322458.1 hypothetical protein [Pararhizobium capsulatum DSM 1112]